MLSKPVSSSVRQRIANKPGQEWESQKKGSFQGPFPTVAVVLMAVRHSGCQDSTGFNCCSSHSFASPPYHFQVQVFAACLLPFFPLSPTFICNAECWCFFHSVSQQFSPGEISISDTSPRSRSNNILFFFCTSPHRDAREDQRESLSILPYVSMLNPFFQMAWGLGLSVAMR